MWGKFNMRMREIPDINRETIPSARIRASKTANASSHCSSPWKDEITSLCWPKVRPETNSAHRNQESERYNGPCLRRHRLANEATLYCARWGVRSKLQTVSLMGSNLRRPVINLTATFITWQQLIMEFQWDSTKVDAVAVVDSTTYKGMD